MATLGSTFESIFWAFLRALPLAGLYFLLVCALVYPILNIWLQGESYTSYIILEEATSGVFQLRIVSFVAACSALMYFVKGLGETHTSSGRVVGQYSFYFIVLAALWYVRIFSSIYIDTKNPTLTLLQICSWLLFFVIDDWSIIAKYTTAFAVRPIWHHRARIWFSNCAFMVLLYCILTAIGHPVLAFIALAAQIACLAYGLIDTHARRMEDSRGIFWRTLLGQGVPVR